MTKEPSIVSDLMCLDCGNVFPIRRMILHQKKEGHIKDLYCPTCKMETKHFELKDKDKFLWKYNHLTDEDIKDIKPIDNEIDNVLYFNNYIEKGIVIKPKN